MTRKRIHYLNLMSIVVPAGARLSLPGQPEIPVIHLLRLHREYYLLYAPFVLRME